MHVERCAALHLSTDPATALPLFSPEGERRWVAGWEPEPLHAPGGTLSASGAVFRTRADGEETLWLVLAFDRERGRAAYARLTPGSRLGTVEVELEADRAGGTRARVTYRLTSLSERGAAALSELTPDAFAGWIAGWERDLAACLAESGA
ncbi:MAG: SRPBCC family protein [Thermoanaerobaculia bacterium]|nr:MAG: SRPBCC family protein [Thermoanaerobaculia bacterium]